ncbi:MAG TPA: ATP-binding protein, partial [Dehalococcoidia bacterium]|nr:ATP-binding protein [Dehalococcoidia bacterium]
GLNQLAMLIEQARGAGLDVRIEITGGERPLPAAVDLAAYRIVQEALTNVLRHAHARHACIRLAYNEGGVEVEVSDDGRGLGTGPRSEGGRGLRGMAERAAAVGGSVEAGPAADGGFRVLARLPLGEATA